MPVNQPFVYTPDYNDPELRLLRTRALEDAGRSRARYGDEIARAGLLGSGAGLASMADFERGMRSDLGSIDDRVFARQRADALDLYRDELAFKRQQELLDQQNSGFRLGALADIGSLFLPGAIGGVSKLAGLFGGPSLPTQSLQAYSGYAPLPERR